MPRRRARHRASRPVRRFLFGGLLLAIPLTLAFGLTSLAAQHRPGGQDVQASATAQRTKETWTRTPATSPPTKERGDRKRKQDPADGGRRQNQQDQDDQRKPADEPNPNCTLTVPANPLTAQGLAAPYVLTGTEPGGACHEATDGQSAFVEATILDPATGKLSVYRPLVIDRGTKPAAAPVVPTLPAGAVVGIWFGFNGDTLALRGTANSLEQGNCVNGLGESQFGQFAYCNAPAFFSAANGEIAAKKLVIPPLGTGKDGLPCPTVRDFGVVDQDQSDNVDTTYLATADGRTAQAGNPIANATVLANGSDNRLLNAFVEPALGCRPFTAPDLTAGGAPTTSLALNELQAAAFQQPPSALIPPNDPMTLVDDQPNLVKANLYRAGVNQPPVNLATDTAKAYCTNMVTIGRQRLKAAQGLFAEAPSPDPEAARNLLDFLEQRLAASVKELNCGK
ncbi:MAG TPA: hypothetical protein VJT49_08725 [Amycolatopsis sp.]|uniref:hypothetical protein n=1 Tax=Amycolatopsis sp. TaxID=37632 RepID=UPI002B45E3A0|nr:hypothetical protein [Amycolatopsis sp.]HKS45184.1 hypothetical protein [Amycolatopsis sp.]